MSRKHSYRGTVAGHERRIAKLEVRADQLARRSARRHGVVVSPFQMAELRRSIAKASLPETFRYIGQAGPSTDAYAVHFNGVSLVTLHDRRGQLIAVFMPEEQVDLHQ